MSSHGRGKPLKYHACGGKEDRVSPKPHCRVSTGHPRPFTSHHRDSTFSLHGGGQHERSGSLTWGQRHPAARPVTPARASEAAPPAPLPCDTAKYAQLRVDKCIEDRCGSPRGLVAVAPLHTRRCGTGERERGPVRHCGSGGTPAFHFGRLTRPTPMKMQSEPLARAATRRSPPSERDAERTSPLSTLQLNHIQGCVGATHKLLRSRHNHTAIPLGPAATLGRLHAEVGAEELVNRRLGLRGGAPTARQGLHLGPLVNLLAQHGVSLRYA